MRLKPSKNLTPLKRITIARWRRSKPCFRKIPVLTEPPLTSAALFGRGLIWPRHTASQYCLRLGNNLLRTHRCCQFGYDQISHFNIGLGGVKLTRGKADHQLAIDPCFGQINTTIIIDCVEQFLV